MWPRFGIKIGNSTLCIAYIKSDGKVEVIANKQGDRVSQACLLWDGISEIECGLTAKQKMALRPKQGVANSFQLLLPESEIDKMRLDNAIKEIPCEYDSLENVFVLKNQNPQDDAQKELTKKLSPFGVHVQLLRAELDLARQYHHDAKKKPIVVLSIPSYYPASAYVLLSNAAKEAGFHVAQVIAEPTAAVLGYNITISDESKALKHVLTIKCGGLYSHFALCAIENGCVMEVATCGPYAIGGRQYTEALMQFICDEFQRRYKLDPHESRRSLAKIKAAATNCKHILTTLPSTQIYIDSLMDGLDFNLQMSRARFESLIQPVITNFMQTLDDCVVKTLSKHAEINKIHEIVLLGATMQIPKLQSAISSLYPNAKLHNSLSADEVVAIGCARQAQYLLDPQEEQLQKTDKDVVMTAEDFYIWHGKNEANAKLVLSKGAILPARVHVSVKQDDTDETDIFRMRTGDSESKVRLAESEVNEQGLYQIIVDVTWDDKSGKGLEAAVRLSCI